MLRHWSYASLLLFGAAIWTAGTAYLQNWALKPLFLQLHTLNYKETQGQVVSTTITRKEAGSHDRVTKFVPVIQYEFDVNGQVFSASRHSFPEPDFRRQSNAVEFLSRFPEGANLDIYFNPADPASAVIDNSIRGRQLSGFVLMTPLYIIAIGVWLAGLNRIRCCMSRSGGPVTPSAHASRTRNGLQLRVNRHSPLVWSVFIAFAIAVVLLFFNLAVYALILDRPAPLWFYIFEWTLIVALALCTALWARTRRTDELELDKVRRCIVFDSGGASNGTSVAPFQAIRSIKALQSGHAYVTRIEWHSQRDGRVRRHIGRGSPRQAEIIAEWLREQIRRETCSPNA